MTVSIAPKPCSTTTPGTPSDYMLMLDFLADRFPKVPRSVWSERMQAGKVMDGCNKPITPDSPFEPDKRILYYREVTNELRVPFIETIIYRNDHVVIADKPHFLPTIPSGPYVTECLLYRLRRKLGSDDLVPVNRLDRETAGLVMFSLNPETRGKYSALFSRRRVKKTYLAAALSSAAPAGSEWTVETRIEKSSPWFRRCNAEGTPNSKTIISVESTRNNLTLFRLEPVTGKQHQLRLHMCHIGFPILYDPFYPELQEERKTGFDKPLQLLARQLSFADPITGEHITATSQMKLSSWEDEEEGRTRAK